MQAISQECNLKRYSSVSGSFTHFVAILQANNFNNLMVFLKKKSSLIPLSSDVQKVDFEMLRVKMLNFKKRNVGWRIG